MQRSHPALIYIPSLRQTNSDLESTCGQLRSDAEALRRSLDGALQRGRAAEGDRESMETQLAAKDAELEKFKLAMSSTVSCCCVKCVEACAPEKLLMCVHQCCSCRWWYNTRCLAKHLKPWSKPFASFCASISTPILLIVCFFSVSRLPQNLILDSLHVSPTARSLYGVEWMTL